MLLIEINSELILSAVVVNCVAAGLSAGVWRRDRSWWCRASGHSLRIHSIVGPRHVTGWHVTGYILWAVHSHIPTDYQLLLLVVEFTVYFSEHPRPVWTGGFSVSPPENCLTWANDNPDFQSQRRWRCISDKRQWKIIYFKINSAVELTRWLNTITRWKINCD